MKAKEKRMRKELDSLSEEARKKIVQDYLKQGGEDSDLVRKIESHRRPKRLESPNDKSLRAVQTK